MKVKKGDTVVVIAGKDKGATGKVIAGAARERDKGHRRGRQPGQEAHTGSAQTQRGAEDRRHRDPGSPIHVSNVMVVDADGKPTRVGSRIDDETASRCAISRRSGKDLLMTDRREGAPRLKRALPRRDRGAAAVSSSATPTRCRSRAW